MSVFAAIPHISFFSWEHIEGSLPSSDECELTKVSVLSFLPECMCAFLLAYCVCVLGGGVSVCVCVHGDASWANS